MTVPVSSRPVATDLDTDDLTPGLHVLREVSPLERAGTLALRLRADLCVTIGEADAIAAERASLSSVDDALLSSLRVLATRLATADRIARRTHDRAVVDVSERMADRGGVVAVHPSTVRERASALEKARVELFQAEQLLEANETLEPEVLPPLEPVEPMPPAPDATSAVPAKRQRRLFGFLRRNRDEVEDTRESTELLRSMAVATEEAFGARRASAAKADQRTLLLSRRDSALEIVRVAQRAWHDLAGEGADPAEVEEVVRRLDPQHENVALIAQEMASVRTASSLLDGAMASWQVAWADLGRDAPLPAAAMEGVDDLAAQTAKAVVLVGAATERGPALAEAVPAAPVVVIEELLDVMTDLTPDAPVPEPGSGTGRDQREFS